MDFGRRDFVVMAGTAALATFALRRALLEGEKKMYGLIGKMTAVSGQRDALIAILIEGVRDMPGCLSYVVAKDPSDANTIWITEVWDNQDSHKASLSLPSVKQAIARGKPLIAGFGDSVVTEPVGGHGLEPAKARCAASQVTQAGAIGPIGNTDSRRGAPDVGSSSQSLFSPD